MNGRVQRTLLLMFSMSVVLPAAPAVAGGGCHATQSPQPVAGTTVVMDRMCFTPGVLSVDPGTTVRFTNNDQLVHVVFGTGWGSGDDLPPGATDEHRFTAPGVYPYSCYLHPGMNGAVVVSGDASAGSDAAVVDTGVELAGATAPASTSSGSDARPLALGGLTGAAIGSLATGWRRRRRLSA